MEKPSEVVGRLTIPCRDLKGKLYGAVPVNDLFAVMCGEEKWCSTQGDCERWLSEHGLTPTEASLVLEVGQLLNEKKNLQESVDLAAQEEQGLFEEEVAKIVEGVLEDLHAVVYSTKDELAWACHRAVEDSSYSKRPELALSAVKQDVAVLLKAAQEVLDRRVQKLLAASVAYEELP